MQTNDTGRTGSRSDTPSTVFGAAALLIVGLCFLPAFDAARYAVPFVAIAALAGFLWGRSRAHARRRSAALEAYAEREIARAAAAGRSQLAEALSGERS